MKPSVFVHRCVVSTLLALSLLGTTMPVSGADFKKDIVYQIVTDRFCNGRTDNDDPPQSMGMFDPSKTNWHAYWGGDLAGIIQKLDYIKHLGATAIWISPPVDNVNKGILNDQQKISAPYHGYYTRDFKRIEEHFGDPSNSWNDFDALTKTAHAMGIKVIIDLPANHTSQYNRGEWGVLYDDGHFKCESNYDKWKYFHHLPQILDWNDRYQLQYGTLHYLADLDQENTFIDRYLKAAVERFQKHGADATRLDAAKHITWGWEHSLANYIFNRGDHLFIAEWFIGNTSEPLYPDGIKFANKGGISLLDFPLAFAIRKVFATVNADFADIDRTLKTENNDLLDQNSMFTFIDNHDVPRFLSLGKGESSLRLALSFLMTCRGTPVILYGTEQNLHNDTNGGDDPYDRPWMSSFDETGSTFALIQKLSAVRSANHAFAYGDFHALFVSPDVYVFERRFGKHVVVTAINKNSQAAASVQVKTSLPPREYEDCLSGAMHGAILRMDANAATTGASTTSPSTNATVTLPANSVSIWSHVDDGKQSHPSIGNVGPSVVNGGMTVTLSGQGFGTTPGRVLIKDEEVTVNSWSPDSVRFTAPYLKHGRQSLTIITSDGVRSDTSNLQIVEEKLIPIRFVVKNMPLLEKNQQLFITGNVFSLGEGKTTWQDAAGPMLFSEDRDYILCVAMPVRQHLDLRLIVLDQTGRVVRQESQSHHYQVPESGSWREVIEWQE